MQRFLNWLQEKGGQRPSNCPVCGRSDRWAPGDVVVPPELTEQGDVQIDAQNVIPMVQLICHNCGYIRLFHANIVGLGGEGYTRGS